jgi:hypothetical protein
MAVDEENWKRHEGEGENMEAGSMMNRHAEAVVEEEEGGGEEEEEEEEEQQQQQQQQEES